MDWSLALEISENNDGTTVIVVKSVESSGHTLYLTDRGPDYEEDNPFMIKFGPSSTVHTRDEVREMRDAFNELLEEESSAPISSASAEVDDEGKISVGGTEFQFG